MSQLVKRCDTCGTPQWGNAHRLKQIYEWIGAESVTTASVAEAFDLTRPNASNLLHRLRNSGLLRHESRPDPTGGVYYVYWKECWHGFQADNTLIDCVKITSVSQRSGYVVKREEALHHIIESLWDTSTGEAYGEAYEIEAVQMTQSELDALPEFDGF